jgi:hypothetical protein
LSARSLTGKDTDLYDLTLKKIVALFVAVIALGAPAAAMAQDPSSQTYKPDSQILGEVGEVDETPAAPADDAGTAPQQESQAAPQPVAADTAGSLPFTGTDVLLLALGGALLLGLGFSLRRFSRSIA